MKQSVKTLAVVLAGAGLVAFAAAPALCGDEFCAMGGTQIKVEVSKEKAIEWGKDHKPAVIASEDKDDWSVLSLSKTDDDIAILVTEGSVFFGAAGKGGKEVDAEKAYGDKLRKLVEAVRKEMNGLWKEGAVKLRGDDIQKISDAVGLGVLEKDGEWVLKTQDCKGLDLDTTDLD